MTIKVFIGVLLVVLAVNSWLLLACSQNNAMADIYAECNSYTMYEDGSYTCEKDNKVQRGCIEGAICED